MTRLWTSRVEPRDAFGREELFVVEFTARDGEGEVVEVTMCKSAVDGSPLRCWGMRWARDETCSGDGVPVYRFQGEEVPGYLICAKHAVLWRLTYQDRGPYTIRSWDGFGG
jgi:hypothetical protein